MRGRRRILRHPALFGVAIALAGLVALVISYNADTSVPLRPTYHVAVLVPDAAQVRQGDPVRYGGARVGVVERVRAVPAAPPYARIDLAVFGGRRVPVDSTVTIRPLSILGAKAVQLDPGGAAQTLPDGGTLPLSRARPTVDLPDALSTFDAPTRAALRGTVQGLGNGLTGRGVTLNRALAATAPLLAPLERVSDVLAAPATHLGRLIIASDALMTALDPVAGDLPELFSNAADTFGGLADAEPALSDLLHRLPPAEAGTAATLTAATPVLRDAAAISRALEPASARLGASATRLDATLAAAALALTALRGAAPVVGDTATALRAIVPPRSAGLRDSLIGLDETVRRVLRLTDVVNPAQLHCNALGVFLRNGASIIGEGDANGSWFSFVPMLSPLITTNATVAPADTHYNAHPIQDERGCAAGNAVFDPGQAQRGNPAVLSSAHVTTVPPAIATERARAAGLLAPPEGARLP